jgi:signal peptidase
MSPAIEAGDVVFVEDTAPSSIERGDVITFKPTEGALADNGERVTHRVTAVQNRDGERYFKTKGDANDSPDNVPVPPENVIGVVSFHVPLIGYVISFASTQSGSLLFVVLPASLLIFFEVRDIYREYEGEPTRTDGDEGQ